MKTETAVILLSGGIDSTVMLAYALSRGRQCHALSFDYGQRQHLELDRARDIAAHYNVPWRLLALPRWDESASALLSPTAPVPVDRDAAAIAGGGIPNTYVPARNTLFLAYALAYAEIIGATEIYFGGNADDTSPYPDCRPAFFAAFQHVAHLATRQGVTGDGPLLRTPLMCLSKREVVTLGRKLQAPLHMTFSCYAPIEGITPCGRCDACSLSLNALEPSL